MLKCFKSDYLNGIGDIDKSDYKIVHNHDYPFFLEHKIRKIQSMKNSIYFSLDYRQKKIIIEKVKKTDKYNKLVRFSYIYTKNVDNNFHDWNVTKSRGQPPPLGRGKDYFLITGLTY